MSKKDKKRAPKESVQAGSASESLEEERIPDQAKVRNIITGPDRVHFEGLGTSWSVVTGIPPKQVVPQVVATVIKEGGTRPSWKWQDKQTDYVMMAWPKDQPLRAAVLMSGEVEQKLKPVNAFPLLEGLPNDFSVGQVYPFKQGHGANVGCVVLEEQTPMWFYDPFYVRDQADLTEGVTHTFLLAGLAFGFRRALLDEITVTKGPIYEGYAQEWLEEHQDKTRLAVPPLKINVAGKRVIQPGSVFGEYQMRSVIDDIDECVLDKMPVKIIYTNFPLPDHPPLSL
ncbi:MAG: hypothetical protein IJU40_01160, partial [Desulfovibrionaceae bacterium]|nr:hypothetical protein [Desulfovibrionaceae bacterium]